MSETAETTDTVVTLTTDHGILVVALVAITIHYLFVAFFHVGSARRRAFPKEFMERNFGEIHKHEIGGEAPQGGYPDMGTGRYSEQLTYAEWYHFNNAQRAHYNYLEQLPLVLFFGVAGGLQLALYTWIACVIYLVGRVFYAVGYVLRGPKGRLIGALITDLGLLALLVLAATSGFMIIF